MAAEAAGWRWLEQYAAEHPEIRPDIRPGPSAPLRRAAQIDAD
jgi:hypothetical protein